MTDGWLKDSGSARQRIAEVVESASDRFVAQCYRIYESPPLGGFVRTESPPSDVGGSASGNGSSSVFAVVCGIRTEALDPGRPVIARGEDEVSEEDVYRSNPQLARLLCTRFEAQIVGHGDAGAINQYLPAFPPRIHSFVYSCAREEVDRFTSKKLDFLATLVNSSPAAKGTADEIIAACLRQAAANVEEPRGFLVRAGKTLAVQLAADVPRLNSILKRLSP